MSEEQRETFVIVDANAIVHSSFHGYTPKYDANGQDNRILHGLLNNLIDLTYQIPKIDYLYIVFDPSDGSLYRRSMYPAYKANRPPTDPDLLRQKEVAKKVLEDHLGLACVSHPGYEADDIIGSLAYLARHEYNVVISSPDKDLAQLVQQNVKMLRKVKTKTEKGYKSLTIDSVYEHFGVYPHQIPDLLALMGDDADNLPGIDKVGPKTAANILKKYLSIEHLLAVVHEMEESEFSNLKSKMINSKERIRLIKTLATIVTNLPIEEKAHQALIKAHNIRNHPDYRKRLIKIRNHFALSDNMLELFMS